MNNKNRIKRKMDLGNVCNRQDRKEVLIRFSVRKILRHSGKLMEKKMNRQLTQQGIQLVNKTMELIKEVQIKG